MRGSRENSNSYFGYKLTLIHCYGSDTENKAKAGEEQHWDILTTILITAVLLAHVIKKAMRVAVGCRSQMLRNSI